MKDLPTKAERRAEIRANHRKMIVRGRGIFAALRMSHIRVLKIRQQQSR